MRREHSKTAVRPGKFVLLTYSLTTSHQTAVHCCSTEAHLAHVPFHACLTCAVAKLKCGSERSPVGCGHKEIRRFHVLMHFLSRKKKGTKTAVMSGVAKLRSATYGKWAWLGGLSPEGSVGGC